MTDQTIPAGLTREEARAVREWAERARDARVQDETVVHAARVLLAVLPKRPTLADMTVKERRECQWMQADVKDYEITAGIITKINQADAHLLDSDGETWFLKLDTVTPRPDLPRMEWPGDKKPAPALPDGWRLADHPDHGRVVVTNPTPNSDGRVYYVLPSAECMGYDLLFGPADELTYIDGPTTKEAGTTTGPGRPAVGTVIESADDPRLDALPLGTTLLDRDDDSVTKRDGGWTGEGYIPFPFDCATFGPWTVLHIPKEEA